MLACSLERLNKEPELLRADQEQLQRQSEVTSIAFKASGTHNMCLPPQY